MKVKRLLNEAVLTACNAGRKAEVKMPMDYRNVVHFYNLNVVLFYYFLAGALLVAPGFPPAA